MSITSKRGNRVFSKSAVAALAVTGVVLTGCGAPAAAPPATSASSASSAAPKSHDFEDLERSFGARLGVYAVDTGSGREVAYRADERFAYASTHKVFSAAAVLQKVGTAGLDRMEHYGPADVVANSPITQNHAGAGLTLGAAMDAALRYSDDTGGNLLFRELGGPAALNSWLRSIGDTTSHVDRVEPTLNETAPGDPRDTSTPRAWAADLRTVLLGDTLPAPARTVLTDTMRANTTGATLIRAGLPKDWTVADKTGTADHGTRNDIAVAWPPGRAPIVFVVFSDRPAADAPTDDALVARATAAAIKALG
ncbi:class A beta-lactamase [Amycolatopsis rhabdoformis]|uniref:Beta-lactamase n=1 Tax=Amycolatopsis rhabdoformis TaxID=1448059 RepID=A0ABZ1IBN1_9PSEU|nr:class A beta-lactamase [Amycolatopsis rhabdoformis]WSE31835.1 class A beta-lactamase [Amycolatopsis rhabdoformis]